ncbi:hypothetical protein H2201_005370 [Coniosporium apollinis]|uniref:DUF1989 domain-containing protein n=1 Tax=Coniosporium apollinis TaxID=61459 RepID=A0ABQ9NU91_9PEZI|nr:hypothetical protein H2201_005370 [Coniosporium apollinis]
MASTPTVRPPPEPAYLVSANSPLNPDRALYDRIAATSSASRIPTTSFTIPPRSGLAWHVPAAHILRLSLPDGPQVGDLNLWSAHNPRERFWASRTRQLEASHVSTYNRLWSCLPYLRPLCTIVADSLGPRVGTTEFGGKCHDLLGTRCDPYVNKMLADDEFDFHCHSNLVRAVLPHGLGEMDVHDVLNVFQVTGLNQEGKYFMETCPGVKGDYIEFFAETDLLCALSTCPGGDLSAWGWAEGGAGGDEEGDGEAKKKGRMEDTCRPIKVEVWKLAEEVKEEVLEGWSEPKRPNYRGMHGMTVPQGQNMG